MMAKRLKCITKKCDNYADEDYGLCGTCTEKRFDGIWYRNMPGIKTTHDSEGYVGDTVDI